MRKSHDSVEDDKGIYKKITPHDGGGSNKKPGNNLLSPFKDYHRPQMLNGRVRNGNGCGHLGMVTGNIVTTWQW